MKKCLRDIAEFRTYNDLNHFKPNDIIIPGIAPTTNLVIFFNEDFQQPIQQSLNIVITSKVIPQKELFLHLDTKEFKNYIKNCTNSNKIVEIEKLGQFEIEMTSLKVIKGDDFKNIYFLDNFSFSDIINLYKYMPLTRFLKMLDEKKLTFVSPETWYDPFETRFYLADYSKLNFNKPEVYCMCLTDKGYENEEASWKMYSDGSNSKTVQITFDKNIFLNYLDAYATLTGSTIYIGKANYLYSVNEINNLHKPGSRGYDYYFPKNFATENFINLLCIKRRAFSFENEVRIFIVNNKKTNEGYFKSIPEIDYQSGFVKLVRLSPYPPFAYDDPRKKIYPQLQKIESEAIKAQIKDKLPDVEINQSTLYLPKKDNLIL